MKDKLAEEIIKQFVVEVEGLDGIEYVSHELAIYCMQAYHEAKMKEEKAKKFYDKNTCVVCHQNYVDSANGFDTCGDCLSRI